MKYLPLLLLLCSCSSINDVTVILKREPITGLCFAVGGRDGHEPLAMVGPIPCPEKLQ